MEKGGGLGSVREVGGGWGVGLWVYVWEYIIKGVFTVSPALTVL